MRANSIRINDQWRVCFVWDDGNAYDVEITDYHRLALNIGVSPRRINEIVLGKRRVTAETALRLGRYFDTTPQFWLGLQADYDLNIATDELGGRLDREVHGRAVAV